MLCRRADRYMPVQRKTILPHSWWTMMSPRAGRANGKQAWKRRQSGCMWILAGREIGRITVDWKDAARAYQIQVSDDATDWTTIYAKMNADASDIDIPIYANGRYVRVYCIASWAFNGFGIKEIQVFAYREGEEKCTYEIEEIPETVTGKCRTAVQAMQRIMCGFQWQSHHFI